MSDTETEAEAEVRAFEQRQRSRRSIELTLRLYGLVGATAAAAGLIYLLLGRQISFESDKLFQISLIVAGVSIVIVTQLAVIVFKERQQKRIYELLERDKFVKFLQRWREIEELSHRVSASSHVVSPRDTITHLLKDRLINRSEADTLESALTVRNAIVHNRTPIPIEIIDNYLSQLTVIADRIHSNRPPLEARKEQ